MPKLGRRLSIRSCRSRRVRPRYLVHSILLALVLGMFACAHPVRTEEPQTFPLAVPSRADAVVERDYVGEVHAIRRADVVARIKGRIESVAIDEGQPVAEGQLLFAIGAMEAHQEMRRARAAAASAAAELKAAETERSNAKVLLDKGVVSPAEMALLQAKIESLAAKVDEAKASEGQAAINLGYTEVRAPFAGVVNRVPKKAGSLVDETDVLTTVTDASDVLIYFRVSEREYLEYTSSHDDARDREVAFQLANGERLPGVGHLDAIATDIDRSTGTIAFRARFHNEGSVLKHGSSGKVIVKTYVRDAVTIPQKSTFEVQDHLYVYVVDGEGTAHARRIVPKLRLADTFVVESGLTLGERFIAEGIQKITDGDRIAVRAEAPAGAPTL